MVLEFRRQPLKAGYLTYKFLSTLFVRIPYWLFRYAFKGSRPRPSWSVKRCIEVKILRDTVVFGDITTKTGFTVTGSYPTHLAIPNKPDVKSTWVEPSPNLIAGQLKALADSANVESVKIPGYWHDKKGLDTEINAAPSSGEKVIYYIHGGGFVAYSAHPHDLLASIPKVLVECHPSIKRAFVIEYRLTSALPNDFTNPFPAALLDVLAGYSYLINEVGFSPKDIIVAGDSAGGNLALALARYLAEGLTLPESIPAPPGALILVSPWADIGTSHSLPGSSLETCLASDILTSLDKGLLFNARTNYCGTLGFPSAANTNPYLSPGSVHPEMSPVSFKGFPKTFIISGDAEIFIDQLRDLSRRMKGDLGDDMVYYHEEPDAVHDYIGLDAFQQEGLSTRAKLGTWLLGVFPSGGP